MNNHMEGCKFNGVGAGTDSQRNLDLSTRKSVYPSTCQPVDLYANKLTYVGRRNKGDVPYTLLEPVLGILREHFVI